MPTSFDELAIEASLDLPGCPFFVIAQEIRKASIRFCENTDVWRVSETVNSSDEVLTLTPPNQTTVSNVTAVTVGGNPLTPVSEEEALLNPVSESGTPFRFFSRGNTVTISPKPSVAVDFKFVYSVKPTRNATSIDEVIAEDYSEAFTQGAIFKLAAMPDKDWTNGAKVELAAGVFADYERKAKTKAKGNSSRITKAKFRW